MGPNKAQARSEARARLAAMSASERLEKSRQILKAVESDPKFAAAGTVLLYASMSEEVATDELAVRAIQRGQKVLLPRVSGKESRELEVCRVLDWQRDLRVVAGGRLREPEAHAAVSDLESVDYVVIPGMAFTREGRRLGRGGGFYDRLLARLPERTFKAGLAFFEQIFDALPVEPHDQSVNKVYWA